MIPLKPSRQTGNNKKIFGFDIETYNKNKNFYCASIFSDDMQKTFFDKQALIDFFKKRIFHNSYVCATNLGFDFFGTFFDTDEMNKFKLVWRGTSLLYAKAKINNNNFHSKGKYKSITFIDSMNYASLSVEKMGRIIGMPKLEKPACLGRLPNTDEEKQELIRYNLRDSEISHNFLKFLLDSFYKLGASARTTIAQTALSLYKNRFLKDTYFRHEDNILLEQFQGYYGGRVEAFCRGEVRKLNYYDFNSLYPSVMLNSYPNPNTLRVCRQNDTSYIESYEGISFVEVSCPEMEYPLLPLRLDNKLLFPYGEFSGWHSHIELREAMKLGYTIKKIRKTYYYKETVKPFYDYVVELYRIRQEMKKDNNPMEFVIKILLNSLYGKFGQKFTDRSQWLPIPETLSELERYSDFERFGDYIRINQKYSEPSYFCFPIWCIYTTAYGRLKLYDIILRSRPYYCDTDSIITEKEYFDSSELGALKKEMPIKYGVIVRPKFYGFVADDNSEHVKIKGLGQRLNYPQFEDFLSKPKLEYEKFMKFKESVRRGFIPNEVQTIIKQMSLDDDKREWGSSFSFRVTQFSKPRRIILERPVLYSI